ncbi:membrane dipeptidase [Rhodovibrionaceae bacterium A322]
MLSKARKETLSPLFSRWLFPPTSSAALASCLSLAFLVIAAPPMQAQERRAEAEQLVLEGFVVDGNLSPVHWVETDGCTSGSAYGCWDTARYSNFNTLRQRTGIDLLSTSGNYSTSAQANRQRVRTSNDLDTARWNNRVGVIRYIQKPEATLLPLSDDMTEAELEQTAQAQVNLWYDDGIRILQPAYSRDENHLLVSGTIDSRYVAGANEDDGLDLPYNGNENSPCNSSAGDSCRPFTPFGEKVVEALFDKDILIDLSHIGRSAALKIAEMALERDKIVIMNHANAAAVYADQVSRNQDDDVICAVARTGGVIGVTPVRFMLANSPLGTQNKWQNRDLLIAHINHMRDLRCLRDNGTAIAMVNHIGVASDSYVNGAPDQRAWNYVRGFNDLDRWIDLADRMLTRHGYTREQLRRILGANFLRVYEQALPGLKKPTTRTRVTVIPSLPAGQSARLLTWSEPEAVGVPRAGAYRVYLYELRNGRRQFLRSYRPSLNRSATITLQRGRAYSWFVRAFSETQRVNSRWQDIWVQ